MAPQRDISVYVDADLQALGRSLVAARYDVTYPGDPGDPRRGRDPSPITEVATPDTEWIATVADLGWIAITRNWRITKVAAERAAVRSSGLRMVVLDTRRDRTTWGELCIVVRQWSRITALLDMAGPSVHMATLSTFRQLDV